MRKLLTYTILISTSLFLSLPLTAQINSLYFMKGVPQAYQINPAFQPNCNVFFGIPGISGLNLHVENSSFGLGDVLKYDPESDSLIFFFKHAGDLNTFLNLLKDRNSIDADVSVPILSFGFRTKTETYITLDISERATVNAYYPKDLIRLPVYGPDSAMTFDFNGLGVDMSLYNEFALGISQKIGDRLTVGWRGKLLFGQSNLRTQKSDIVFTSGEDAWPVHSNIRLDATMPFVNVVYDDKGMIDFEKTDIRDNADQNIPHYILNPKNFGLAMDIGADFRPLDWLQLSASLVDFGMIKWKDGVHNLESHSDYEFLGIPTGLSDEDYMQTFLDSLDVTFNNFSATEKAYSTWLPTKIYAGAAFYVHPKISFGVLSRTMIYHGDVNQQFTFSANLYPIRPLSATFSYSIIDGTYKNLGFGLALKGGPLNIYLISDTAPSVYFWPVDARYFDLKVGVNFVFGCKKLGHKTYDKPLVD